MIKTILMDIEGTTTSISFVHDTLFPYSTKKLPEFCTNHSESEEVQHWLSEAQRTIQEEDPNFIKGDLNPTVIVPYLLSWIKADRKHPALKGLQGLVWREGYEKNVYQSHIYPDVLPTWELWANKGITLAIYSSGSCEAQKLLFGHTSSGDITSFISHYFDTKVGPKKEKQSYAAISQSLSSDPEDILFISDIEGELDAAKQSGLCTLQMVRSGTTPTKKHARCDTFSHIDLELFT